jgi:hypothetical protein
MLDKQSHYWEQSYSSNLELDLETTLSKLIEDEKLSEKTQLLLALNSQLLQNQQGPYEEISLSKKKELARLLRAEAEIYSGFDLAKSLACHLLSSFYLSGTVDSPEARRINAFLAQTIASTVTINRLH